jgi:hypothetical protein
MRRQEMAKHSEEDFSRQSGLTKFPVIDASANHKSPIHANSAITKAGQSVRNRDIAHRPVREGHFER